MTRDEANKLKRLISQYTAYEAGAAEAYAEDKENTVRSYGVKAKAVWSEIVALVDANIDKSADCPNHGTGHVETRHLCRVCEQEIDP